MGNEEIRKLARDPRTAALKFLLTVEGMKNEQPKLSCLSCKSGLCFGALRRKLTPQSKINCRNNKIKPLV